MKTIKLTIFSILGATLLGLGLYSCSNDDTVVKEDLNKTEIGNKANRKTVTPEGNNNYYKITNFGKIKIEYYDSTNYKLNINNLIKNYNIIRDNYSIKIIEENGKSILIDKLNEKISFFDGNEDIIDPNKVYVDDLMYIFLNEVGYDITTLSDKCIHTAIAIEWRKSLAELRVKKLISDYLGSHEGCKQLGGLDTFCYFGDFACVTIGEIECERSSINDCN